MEVVLCLIKSNVDVSAQKISDLHRQAPRPKNAWAPLAEYPIQFLVLSISVHAHHTSFTNHSHYRTAHTHTQYLSRLSQLTKFSFLYASPGIHRVALASACCISTERAR